MEISLESHIYCMLVESCSKVHAQNVLHLSLFFPLSSFSSHVPLSSQFCLVIAFMFMFW